jgi:hypothetical protein
MPINNGVKTRFTTRGGRISSKNTIRLAIKKEITTAVTHNQSHQLSRVAPDRGQRAKSATRRKIASTLDLVVLIQDEVFGN